MTQRFVSCSGRTAIVTGSGRNIGRAIALALAEGGANVVVNGHSDRDAVDAVVAEIRGGGGNALGVMADVSAHEEVAELVRKTVSAFGSVDIAISNVGVRRRQPFLDISPEDWKQVLDTNLSPAFYMARSVIPLQAGGADHPHFGFDGFWGR
jgi:3-oxoacyl-[acyl-carrier protein] reductase